MEESTASVAREAGGQTPLAVREAIDRSRDEGARRSPLGERNAADRFILAAIALLTSAHVAYYFPRVVDDLFISLRYAENFARGDGAVYNLGERVEGFSSPAWMVLQSVGLFLGFEGVTWTKGLGCLSLFAIQYGLFRLCRDVLGVRGLAAFIPSLFCAANSYVVNWAVLGLETPLHLALIVGTPVALAAGLKSPTSGRRILANVVLVALGTTRPEAPLYLLANVAGFVWSAGKARYVLRVRELARLAWPAACCLTGLLLLRYAYYGYFVPNTYFVKGDTAVFDLENLAPLWGQGAGALEVVLYIGGVPLLAYYGAVRGNLAPALSVLACSFFTASVRLDWMPSLRHLLPVTVLAPVGWACLIDSVLRSRSLRWRTPIAALGLTAAVGAAVQVAVIDNRNSPEERRGRGWIRPKSWQKWEDTLLSYQRVEPPHVERMGKYEMGQVTQAWHVLEASAEPVSDSWFMGRDIGAVGYYTGVRVFDTAGLVTAEVSHSKAWTGRRQVSDELLRSAMARRPLAGEIYEGWDFALGRHPDLLEGYKIRRGSKRRPTAFLATDRVPPSKAEIVRRYETMVEKFPRLYYLNTLYGESVGAVVEKRLRVVRRRAAAEES